MAKKPYIIALEEHYQDPEVKQLGAGPGAGREVVERLDDLGALRIREMDEAGIDLQVLSHSIPGLQAVDAEAGPPLARRTNDRLHEAVQHHPDRFSAFAVLPTANPRAAADELERAVTQRGAVGGVLPTYLPQSPDFGDSRYDPIYAAAERLGVGLGFHTGTSANSLGGLRFRKFLSAHTIDHPAEQMMALIATIIGGVFERFPTLKIAYLESGAGWVPYMMDRLDEEVEKRGADEASYLTKLPSEYVRSGRIFFGVECGEKTIPDAVRWGLDHTLLYSSDYPHWDGDWPRTVKIVRKRTDLSDTTKQKMLHDNVARFYGLQPAM
jgi:predicted TIM-barrel fold metal-dependent hydrolase